MDKSVHFNFRRLNQSSLPSTPGEESLYSAGTEDLPLDHYKLKIGVHLDKIAESSNACMMP